MYVINIKKRLNWYVLVYTMSINHPVCAVYILCFYRLLRD